MKTTLNLDDDLMRRIKAKAAMEDRTMTDLIEEALRKAIEETDTKPAYKLPTSTFSGKLREGVDINSREKLYDLLDES